MKKYNLFILLMAALCLPFWSGSVSADEKGMETRKMWARATIGNSTTTAVYGVIENITGVDDALISVSTPLARMAQIHRTTKNDMGVMNMEHMEKVVLKDGTFVIMEPGDIHIMLMGLEERLEAGFEIPLKFEFENAPAMFVRVPVYPATTKFGDVK